MNRCLICNEVIEPNFNDLFCAEDKVCFKCVKGFEVRNSRFVIDGVKGIILFYYNDFFKELLYRYKGCYDYVLKDVFLSYKIRKFQKKYKGYTLVLAPSNKDEESRRGFNHLEQIFKGLNLPILKCFKKTKKWKQSDKNIEERKGIQNVIKIDKSCLKHVKKVLIVDDVLTSGSTIKTLISQLPSDVDKKVLVLSSNCRISSNEIV